MLRCVVAWLVAVAVCVGMARTDEPTEVERLVKDLGSEKFKEREAAMKGLEAIGAPAIAALRAASLSEDADVRRRAEELLRRIESKLEADDVLAPQRLKLAFKDVPLGEAIKDLSRRSGFVIELAGSAVHLAEKPITIETAALPFWEALERFGEAAGVIDQWSLPQASRPRGRRQFGINVATLADARIVLVPAGETRPPMHVTGAIRLRLLPGEDSKDGAVSLVLETALEPRVRWLNQPRLTINKAVDGAGREIAVQVEEPKREENEFDRFFRQAIPNVVIDGRSVFASGRERFPLRLRLAENPNPLLAELKGTLSARAQTQPQVVVEVEEVAKALNETVRGKGDFAVKITKLERAEDGEVELELVHEGGEQAFGAVITQVQVIGGNAPAFPGLPRLSPYALYDADGQPYQERQTSMSTATENGKLLTTAKLLLTPPRAQSTPKRFTYLAPRTSNVDVPLAFRSVQLPKP